MCSACLRINKMFFKFACRIFYHKLHTSFPQTFRYPCSNPKPNKSFRSYISTVNCSAVWTTVVLSSAFRTKTCTTLQNMEKCTFSQDIFHITEYIERGRIILSITLVLQYIIWTITTLPRSHPTKAVEL